MLTTKEKAINNTFQIKEDFKVFDDCKRSFYYPFKRLRPPLRAQLPGRIKIFTEEEKFFYNIKRYRQSLQGGGLL